MWFLLNPPRKATINVENVDELSFYTHGLNFTQTFDYLVQLMKSSTYSI